MHLLHEKSGSAVHVHLN